GMLASIDNANRHLSITDDAALFGWQMAADLVNLKSRQGRGAAIDAVNRFFNVSKGNDANRERAQEAISALDKIQSLKPMPRNSGRDLRYADKLSAFLISFVSLSLDTRGLIYEAAHAATSRLKDASADAAGAVMRPPPGFRFAR